MRCGRRRTQGLSLFGSLLAMALLGMIVLGVIVWLEERSLEDRARAAGSWVETVTHAVSSYVNSRFATLLPTVGTGLTITLAQLQADGALPDGFSERNALGRGLQVMVLPAGTNALQVLVAETLPAGDTLVPSAALLGERYGGVRMGVVAPEAPTQLRGPTIQVSVANFQGTFAGVPQAGALGALMRFDHQSVCGDQLYRVQNTGCVDANTMETALDLGGNDIVDAKRVEAESFDVAENIETGGELIVTGLLTVGQALEVTGEVTVAGEMSAQTGAFTGTVTTQNVQANEHVQTGTLTATGTVTAATVSATGAMTAGTATMGDFQSATMDAQVVNATNVTADRAGIDTMQATGHMTAASAGISRLTVGSCSGC